MNLVPDVFVSYPVAQYSCLKNEILAAIKHVCESNHYILGPEVEAFENEFSNYNNVKYCIGVGSGTDALIFAMRALGIGRGDEVITVSHTALATVAAIIATGATPVLIDIEENFYTMDPNKIESVITEKTKAIIPVHLYGQPCDMQPILAIAEKYKLKVIEDCAQATGAEYHKQKIGTFGDVGCFSFYPTKNLGGIGDGGAIITNSESVAEKVAALRQYGWDKNRVAQATSTVSRLDELQAAILRVKLKYLDQQNSNRREIANTYNKLFSDSVIQTPSVRKQVLHAYHLYVIRTNRRAQLQKILKEHGINTVIHYKEAVHHHPAYQHLVRIPEKLQITEAILSEIVSLPIYPELTLSIVERIATLITAYFSKEDKKQFTESCSV